MNRSELIKTVSALKGVDQQIVTRVAEGVFDILSMTLACDESIMVSGFGKFEVKLSPPATRRNPRTGEPVPVPEKRVVKFRPSNQLKARMNGSNLKL